MNRLIIYLSVWLQMFLFSLPVFAKEDAKTSGDTPGSLLQTGLNQAAEPSGFDKTLGLSTLIGKMISVILGAVGIAFVILTVLAGIKYMTAGGDENKVKEAKKSLTQAVIGIVIIIAAYAISSFVIGELIKATTK